MLGRVWRGGAWGSDTWRMEEGDTWHASLSSGTHSQVAFFFRSWC